MKIKEFREFLNNDEKGAIEYLNEYFKNGGKTDKTFKEDLGFSYTAAMDELKKLGYHKPNGKLICKIGEEGVKVMGKEFTRFTEEEILFLKELYKNRELKENKEVSIKVYGEKDAYSRRSFVIANELLTKLNKIFEDNKIYKNQDIFNEIIRLGIEEFNK